MYHNHVILYASLLLLSSSFISDTLFSWLLSQQLGFWWHCLCSRVCYDTLHHPNELLRSAFIVKMWQSCVSFVKPWMDFTYDLVLQVRKMNFWTYWESILFGSDQMHEKWLIALNLFSSERLLFLVYWIKLEKIFWLYVLTFVHE